MPLGNHTKTRQRCYSLKYCLYDVPLEEKKNLAQVNDRMCKLILHRSNKKTMLTNTLIALMVLTNIANTMRNNDHS